MDNQEYNKWLEFTKSSSYRWTLDEVTLHNRKEYLFYFGGTDGNFIRISNTGMLNVGTYEGAIPHIGEATFTIKWKKQFTNSNTALRYVIERAGLPILRTLILGQDCYA